MRPAHRHRSLHLLPLPLNHTAHFPQLSFQAKPEVRSRDEISGLTVKAEEAADVTAYEISCHHAEIDGYDGAEIGFQHVMRKKGNVECIGDTVAEAAEDENANAKDSRDDILSGIPCIYGLVNDETAENGKKSALPPAGSQSLIDYSNGLCLYVKRGHTGEH